MLTDLLSSSIALAANDSASTGNPIASLLPFLLIGVVFYFLIIRPQKKRQQQQQSMVSSLGVGDRVVTIGGFHGEIVGLTGDTMQLELAPGIVVTMARNAISKSLTEPDPLDDDDLDFGDDDLDDDRGRMDDLDQDDRAVIDVGDDDLDPVDGRDAGDRDDR